MTSHNKTPRKIVLGITGGIAAYKAAELVRLLVKQNIEVQVVMTEAACQFITPVTMQALSGNPVHTNMWDSQSGGGMPHIDLTRDADAVLIAPASADFIAKLIHGQADDLLSTLCLARDCTLLVAPAMNKQMWDNPSTQRNIAQAKLDNITVLGPGSGEQACGEIGFGRMLEPEEITALVTAHFTPKLLKNKNIMVTAGATMEMIDPVRGITNISSGKMGYAISQVASDMGANVTLVSGISALEAPSNLTYRQANSADAMYQTVMQHIGEQDVFISVAAVSDYSPTEPSQQKIKKNASSLSITLKKNQDILAKVASLPAAPFCVGFAAETENLIEYASKKRIAKNIPMIVANLVSESMGKDNTQVTIIDDNGTHRLEAADKTVIAAAILAFVEKKLR
jgi:phosphopantothenoylcysteine decarboxylase/phosphopantothenate--cysteine ligase